MTTEEMITELRAMQKQIIHGTKFFGEVADRLEKVSGCMRRVEELESWFCDECNKPMAEKTEGFLGKNGIYYCSEECYEEHLANQ